MISDLNMDQNFYQFMNILQRTTSSLLANVSTNLYIHDLSYKHNVDEPVARS